MSDRVDVISRRPGQGPRLYRFRDYASFARNATATPTNEDLSLSAPENELLSSRLRLNPGATGTHIRVQITGFSEENVLGEALKNFTHEKFAHVLRLYTPIGQVNDYLLHPAFHTHRKEDLTVWLTSNVNGALRKTKIALDVLRFSELHVAALEYDSYVDAGWPPNHTVHTIHREMSGGQHYLTAADIQPQEITRQAEDFLLKAKACPGFKDENAVLQSHIPRGFYLALSGGMRSELLVRAPKGNTAAFRGFVLSEHQRPTLGRKHVMDQRMAPPRAAANHERNYEEVRKTVLPRSVPPPLTPKSGKWRREFIDKVIIDQREHKPPADGLYIWGTDSSREARVMLQFAELLGAGNFGSFRILRGHLQDKYDFAFLFEAAVGGPPGINATVVDGLEKAGYCAYFDSKLKFYRYGIGEFKFKGEDVIGEFSETDPRKSADMIDLLVCWTFDKQSVEDQGWSVSDASHATAEFVNQTHIWIDASASKQRNRNLCVVSLSALVAKLISLGQRKAFSDVWPDSLYGNYF